MIEYITEGIEFMRLSDGIKGNTYYIGSIDLGENITRRLQMLGMTHGTRIDVLGKKRAGAMIVKVRGTRFALGRGFCGGIFVEESK